MLYAGFTLIDAYAVYWPLTLIQIKDATADFRLRFCRDDMPPPLYARAFHAGVVSYAMLMARTLLMLRFRRMRLLLLR